MTLKSLTIHADQVQKFKFNGRLCINYTVIIIMLSRTSRCLQTGITCSVTVLTILETQLQQLRLNENDGDLSTSGADIECNQQVLVQKHLLGRQRKIFMKNQ